jgi:predicted methyltransferase
VRIFKGSAMHTLKALSRRPLLGALLGLALRAVPGALLILAGCAAAPEPAPPPLSDAQIQALLAAPDRSAADRATDSRRHAAQLLAFVGPAPGMRVADMGAGAGYSSELMARAVGPSGTVYAQDRTDTSGRAARAFTERLARPAMRNVVRINRDYNEPLPADVRGLDLITFFFAYHDTVHMAVDRAQMNRSLFEALKPGGILVVADHAAAPGAGLSVTKTLHRIEEKDLRSEIEAAGFRFVAEADFLHNPADPRTVSAPRASVPVDEFVLKFVKPL